MKKINLLVFGFVFLLMFSSFSVFAVDEDEVFDLCTPESEIDCSDFDFKSTRGVEYDESDRIFVFLPKREGRLEKLVLNRGEDNEVVIEASEGVKYDPFTNRIIVNGEEAKLNINGRSFENIAPRSEGRDSFIQTDPSTGEVIKADFWTTSQGGSYNFEGVTLDYPGNSRVIFEKRENVFEFGEGSEIKSVEPFLLESGVSFSGTDIGLFDDIVFDGETFVDSRGVLVRQGEVDYRGNRIFVDSDHERILIADPGFDLRDYQGNWVRQGTDKLEVQSFGQGRVRMDFLEGHDILNVKEHDSLRLIIERGDGLEVNKGVTPLVSHKSSEFGRTSLLDGGYEFNFKEGDLSLGELDFGVDKVLSEKYRVVPVSIVSDSEKFSGSTFRVNEFGEALLTSEQGETLAEFTDVGMKSLLKLNHEDLTSVAQSLGDNAKNKLIADEIFIDHVPSVLNSASEAGFETSETISLISQTSEFSASEVVFSEIPFALDSLSERYNPEFSSSFILGTVEGYSNSLSADFPEAFESAYQEILPIALEQEISLEATSQFLNEAFNLDSEKDGFDISEQSNFLAYGLRDYDGDNFEDIKKGISVMNEWGFDDSFLVVAKNPEFHFSEIKDKNSLAKNYASSFNSLVEKGVPDLETTKTSARLLSALDRNEQINQKKSEILNLVNKDLSIESKYYLIAQTKGNDLSEPVFEEMFEGFTVPVGEKASLNTKLVREIDPEGKHWLDFANHFEQEGTLGGILFDQDFLVEGMKIALEDPESDLSEDIPKMISLNRYFALGVYDNQRQEFDDFLLEKYNSATGRERAAYAYLMTFQPNPSNEMRQIVGKIPGPFRYSLPSRYSEKDVLGAKIYFYDDEGWYQRTIDDNQNRGFKLVSQTESETVLEKTLPNGKTERVSLEIVPKDHSVQPKVREVLEGDEFQLVSLRGHDHHFFNTFDEVLRSKEVSNTEKLIFLAECYGTNTHVSALREKYPNSFILSDDNKAHGTVNNLLNLHILDALAQGKLNLEDLEPEFARDAGISFSRNGAMAFDTWFEENKDLF